MQSTRGRRRSHTGQTAHHTGYGNLISSEMDIGREEVTVPEEASFLRARRDSRGMSTRIVSSAVRAALGDGLAKIQRAKPQPRPSSTQKLVQHAEEGLLRPLSVDDAASRTSSEDACPPSPGGRSSDECVMGHAHKLPPMSPASVDVSSESPIESCPSDCELEPDEGGTPQKSAACALPETPPLRTRSFSFGVSPSVAAAIAYGPSAARHPHLEDYAWAWRRPSAPEPAADDAADAVARAQLAALDAELWEEARRAGPEPAALAVYRRCILAFLTRSPWPFARAAAWSWSARAPRAPPPCAAPATGRAAAGRARRQSESDIDVVILTCAPPAGRGRAISLLNKFAELLTAKHGGDRDAAAAVRDARFDTKIRSVQVVSNARVPVLRFEEPHIEVRCDVTVDQVLSVHNTALLRAYLAADDRVRALVLLVKKWAGARGLRDASRGSLSAYAWSLLVINFAQCVPRPPLLPCLQSAAAVDPARPAGATRETVYSAAGAYKVEYGRGCEGLLRGGEPGACLAELLVEFFRFYGFDFRYGAEAVSVRSGHIAPLGAGALPAWPKLVVEDPFETDFDCARTLSKEQQAVLVEELRDAYYDLLQGRPFRDICAAPRSARRRPPEAL
eukprot:tig00000241_g20967.t1